MSEESAEVRARSVGLYVGSMTGCVEWRSNPLSNVLQSHRDHDLQRAHDQATKAPRSKGKDRSKRDIPEIAWLIVFKLERLGPLRPFIGLRIVDGATQRNVKC